MDKKYLSIIYNECYQKLKKNNCYRLNFGVYYSPRLVGGK